MKDNNKKKLYLLTFFLDTGLIYLCTKKILPKFDIIWCYFTLLIHATFYYALHKNNRPLLHKLHYLVFFIPFFSLFTKTIYPKILSLFLIMIIQFLWVIENKCILNEEGETMGFGGVTNISIIVLNTLLSFQIGKLI